MTRKAYGLMGLVIFGCLMMAVIETILEPSYPAKSGTKAILFFVLPLLYGKAAGGTGFKKLLIPTRKGLIRSLLLGGAIYLLIVGAFLLTRNIFDYTAIVDTLASDQKVSPRSFIWVAAYISFGNSLLEEFFFRAVAFLKLLDDVDRRVAYAFSSCLFALYHIAMIAASFPVPLILLAVLGLTAGGVIFCRLDEKGRNLFPSWMVHVFADLALMTIWLQALAA